jgi:hypothetical protein
LWSGEDHHIDPFLHGIAVTQAAQIRLPDTLSDRQLVAADIFQTRGPGVMPIR